jgi:hypothetical protein
MPEKRFMINLFSNACTNLFNNSLSKFCNALEREYYVNEEDNLYVALHSIKIPQLTHPHHDLQSIRAHDCIYIEKYDNTEEELEKARKEFTIEPLDKICKEIKKLENGEEVDVNIKKLSDDEKIWYEQFLKDVKKDNSKKWTILGFIKYCLTNSMSCEAYTFDYFKKFLNPSFIFDHRTFASLELDSEQVEAGRTYVEFIFDIEEILEKNTSMSILTFFPFYSGAQKEAQFNYWKNIHVKLRLAYAYTLGDILYQILLALIDSISKFYVNSQRDATENHHISLKDFKDNLYKQRHFSDSSEDDQIKYSEMMKKYKEEIIRKDAFIALFINKFVQMTVEERKMIFKERSLQNVSEQHFLFVNCDLVQFTNCANIQLPLLAVLPIKTFTKSESFLYQPVNLLYNKVNSKAFKSISISLTHEDGNEIFCTPSLNPTHVVLAFSTFD